MKTTDSIAPVKKKDRVLILDVLRGFALFGILMVNMPVFNLPMAALIGELRMWVDPANTTASWIIDFFFHGKFYSLFSLLFGMGFYFFLQKAEQAGQSVVGVFRRRLLILLMIGALHVVLLWYGDILVIYALFGFVMTWFRNKSNKTVLVWAIVFLAIPLVFTSGLLLLITAAMTVPEVAAEIGAGFRETAIMFEMLTQQAFEAYGSGSFSEIVSIRLREYSFVWGGIISFFPMVLAMFLVGLLAGRKGYLRESGKHLGFFRKVLWISLPFALFGNWMLATYIPQANHAFPSIEQVYMLTGFALGGPSLAFVYISLFVFWMHSGHMQWLAKKLAATGQMALTNYLAQSVICTTIFYSYGLGLYGQVDIVRGILLTMAIFVTQVIWSHYWMKHFRFGPVEWVWRTLTYGKKQPMRRK